MRIEMGQKVKDLITGFSGIVTGLTQYITGCRQALVQPSCKGNEFVEGRWFDEDRLAVTETKRIKLAVTDNGPDKPAPVR